MSASTRSRDLSTTNSNRVEDGFDLGGDSSIAPAPGNAIARTLARHGLIAHASALAIYLRHRGALNVEEFRRTNARTR